MIEFILAIFEKLNGISTFIASFTLIVTPIAAVVQWSEDDRGHEENAKKIGRAKRAWFSLLIASTLFSLIPTVSDVWKVRIALVKYRLASSENIQKGVDEISRIAEKLECKYIGCEEKK